LDHIIAAGHRAAEIVQNVRAMFKKDAPDNAPVRINRVVSAVLALVHSEIQKCQVEVQMAVDSQLPTVTGNEVQLQQVILNLVMNAIEAMHSTQRRELRIKSRLSKPDTVHVSIEDTGTGVDPSKLDQLFKPLFTTKARGMGMGLSICRSIIERHGGRIWASPSVRGGSNFQFELPTSATRH
jgi:C4-dicarboxylate-specific signal transduction histidine kinase